MKADTDNEEWRNKYFDSLRSLESDERRFRAMETTLKRLAGRLCIASLGQSAQLDNEIKKLQQAIRGEASSDELERITPALTDAIHALDHSAAPPALAPQASTVTHITPAQLDPHAAIMGDARIRPIIAALLVELKRDVELSKQVEALDATLATVISHEQLPDVLSALADLVGQRIQRIERAKQEIENLLSQMVGKLDEISQFVADQSQNQTQSQANSETLNTQLVDEMQAIGASMESASDLLQIRLQVRSHLHSIGQHLKEFRQREATLVNAIQTRSEALRSRVAELEAKASHLHDQLKNEQRLSLLDVLTQVPNRLAYEKRMEEELQRWQRFGQATCVAAWDIDRFKQINDSYGHRAGDRVLRAVAKCLASRIRATDFLGRYGGEEFVMIFSGTQLDNAVRLIDDIRIAVAKLGFHFRGLPVSVSISCGVTALLPGDSSGVAFDRADKALYQAKDRGRNCCVSI